MNKEELMDKLEKAYENGFVTFWAIWERKQAEEFANRLGWKMSFVINAVLDADLLYVYKDIKCLPKDVIEYIQKHYKNI